MLKIKNNEITLSKGDAAAITLALYSNGQPTELSKGSKFVFSLNTPTKIEKELTSTTLTFESSDTAAIPAGTYEYDIKLVYANGEQVALIYPTQFVLKEVV